MFFNEIKSDDFEVEEYIDMKELRTLILAELEQMSDDQKEVNLLKEYGGLSYKEIALAMNIDVNLVKSRLYKIGRKLIDKISKVV